MCPESGSVIRYGSRFQKMFLVQTIVGNIDIPIVTKVLMKEF